jgi:hypothetical protein
MELAHEAEELAVTDKLWLIERLVRSVREESQFDGRVTELAAMAHDPQIRHEIDQIEEEFAHTEQDGLSAVDAY